MSEPNSTEWCDLRVLHTHPDHIVTLNLNLNEGQANLLERYITAASELTRLCTEGGTIFGQKPCSLDMDVSRNHFKRATVSSFPSFCILIIRLNANIEIAFAIAKSDQYLFAYQKNGVWHNLRGGSYKILGGLESELGVSYTSSDEASGPMMVGLEILCNAIHTLNSDDNSGKQHCFHQVCFTTAECLRFKHIFSKVLYSFENGTTEVINNHELKCVRNWKCLSSLWISESCKLEPSNFDFSLVEMLDIPAEEKYRIRTNEDLPAALALLREWMRENLSLVKGERLKQRMKRKGSILAKNYHPVVKRLAAKPLGNEIENVRANFWNAALEDPDENKRGTWRILQKASNFLVSNDPDGEIKAQLLLDNSDLMVKKYDLSHTQATTPEGDIMDFIIPPRILTPNRS